MHIQGEAGMHVECAIDLINFSNQGMCYRARKLCQRSEARSTQGHAVLFRQEELGGRKVF